MLHLPLRPRPSGQHETESGYVLLAVIFMTFMLLLSLAIAAPKIATSIQRQKELETIHRGEQYKRAIQLYYRKFGRYPTSIDQLVNTNNIRFLRKRYTDPLTGKDDWKLVHFGQAHVRPLGFFGQPLMSGVAGALAGASIISNSMYAPAPATNPDGTPATNPDGSPATASGSDNSASTAGTQTETGTGPSLAGNPGGFGSTSNTGFGSTSNTGFGSTSNTGFGSTSNTGFGSSSNTGFGSTSNTGFGSTPGTGSATDNTPGSAGTTGVGASSNSPFSSSSSLGGGSGTTFGGGGFIVGITLPVNKPSLIDYKKQTSYNHWEFNYDPMEDQVKSVAGAGGGATNVNGATSGTSNLPGVGNPFGGTGNSTSGGSTGTPGGTSGGTTGGPSFGGVSNSGGASGSGGSTDSGSGDSGTQPPSSTPQQ